MPFDHKLEFLPTKMPAKKQTLLPRKTKGAVRSTVPGTELDKELKSSKIDANLNVVSNGSSARAEIYTRLITGERLRPTIDETRRSVNDRDLEAFSDKGRIVRSSPFRRLQSKAQVFSMARSGDVRTRLTHCIEVGNYGELIAETLARSLVASGSLAPDLRSCFVQTVENACLLHDIGNPPFGHMGEYAIQQWFIQNKEKFVKHCTSLKSLTQTEAERHLDAYCKFDGNPQGFRIATRLQWLNDEFGMNLTCSLLASYLKYLGESPDSKKKFRKKVGYFPTEESVIKDVWRRLGLLTDARGLPLQRHPLAFLMEAADDIAFCLSDIEDALEKSVINEEEYIEWIRKRNVPQLERAVARAKEINEEASWNPQKQRLVKNGTYHLFRLMLSNDLVKWAVEAYLKYEDRILAGTMEASLLGTNLEATRVLGLQKEFCAMRVYTSREAISTELGGLTAITQLLDAYKHIILLSTQEFDRLSDKSSVDRLKDYPIDSLLFTLLPQKHRRVYAWCREKEPKLEPIFRIQLIVDYVSGMTDSHVLKIFNMINGTQQFGIE